MEFGVRGRCYFFGAIGDGSDVGRNLAHAGAFFLQTLVYAID